LKFLLSPFLLLAFAAAVTAAPDAWPIIDVTASRLDSQPYLSPYGELSVAEEAASIPGVRLQRQGLGSPQADLRIRGGAFSSSGFALEGLPLFDPQTEHFHADLPLSPLLADRVRLLTGLEQFSAMSGHASGTVDMDLAEPDNHLKFDPTVLSRQPPPPAGPGPRPAAVSAAAPRSCSTTGSTAPTGRMTTT
jgi:hypothetical protein